MALCSRLQMKPMCYLLKESAELKKKKVKRKKKRKPHLWKSKHFAVFDTISQPVEKKTLCE